MSSDLNSYFSEIEKKKSEEESKRQLEKIGLIAKQKLERINDEKQFIRESILKFNEKFPTKKFPLLLTHSFQEETLEWVSTFDNATLIHVDVYIICPNCRMGVLISKNSKIDGNIDHCCQKIQQNFCSHGEPRLGPTCAACYNETSGN